jgi:hypothetical protein
LRGLGKGCEEEQKAEILFHWDSPERLELLGNIGA